MNQSVSEDVKTYLRVIGSKGGKKSRRSLDSAQARRMVAVREARRAFREYHPTLFWSYPPDLEIHQELVPRLVDEMKREGNKEAFLRAGKIMRLWKSGSSSCP